MVLNDWSRNEIGNERTKDWMNQTCELLNKGMKFEMNTFRKKWIKKLMDGRMNVNRNEWMEEWM